MRLIYRDFPLMDIHPGALLASHAANCAALQGVFWPMHDRIFLGLERREWRQGYPNDLAVFVGYAEALQLDPERLRQCIEQNETAAQIEDDVNLAYDVGVRSTPSFLINGELVVGAQPYEVWKDLFDRILAETN